MARNLPQFKKGETIKASKSQALSRQMSGFFSNARGVMNGLILSGSDAALLVTVSPGEFVGLAHDFARTSFSLALPPNKTVYVWIQANDDEEDLPNAQWLESPLDFGDATWVCLGKAVTNANAVDVSDQEDGRMHSPLSATGIGGMVGNAIAPFMQTVGSMIEEAVTAWWTDTFQGDGHTASFSLTFTPIPGSIRVSVIGASSIGGTTQGSVLGFSSPPPNGSTVTAQYTYLPASL